MRNSKILKLITTLFLIGVIFKCIFMAEGISGKMWFSWKRSKAAEYNYLDKLVQEANQRRSEMSGECGKTWEDPWFLRNEDNTLLFHQYGFCLFFSFLCLILPL